jgi:mono/diheme cytochrome c family protein
MGPRVTFSSVRAGAAALAAAGAAVLLTACGSTSAGEADVIAGKQVFVAKCGSCHVLNRAGTKGTAGPDLDQAFQRSLRDGIPRSSVRGVIHDQILYPADFSAEADKPKDDIRADGSAPMPAKIVTGRAAQNVAAYVASVVARPGKDTGLLATAVKQAGGGPPAQAKSGVLSIPADPGGQLAFASNRAEAPPGRLSVEAPNKSATPHDIVIDGKGRGAVVQNGGTSKFSATFGAGTYTYYCSVPGHRQAGMEGRLAVK